jgi:hypothetical protein
MPRNDDKPTDPNTMASTEMEVRPLPYDHDQVISLPAYAGTYNPSAYVDWEFKSIIYLDVIILQTTKK